MFRFLLSVYRSQTGFFLVTFMSDNKYRRTFAIHTSQAHNFSQHCNSNFNWTIAIYWSIQLIFYAYTLKWLSLTHQAHLRHQKLYNLKCMRVCVRNALDTLNYCHFFWPTENKMQTLLCDVEKVQRQPDRIAHLRTKRHTKHWKIVWSSFVRTFYICNVNLFA